MRSRLRATTPRILTKSCWPRCAIFGSNGRWTSAENMVSVAPIRTSTKCWSQENLDGCITVCRREISELGIKLLNQGIPCVVEKPLGISLAEAEALRDSSCRHSYPEYGFGQPAVYAVSQPCDRVDER